MSEPSDTIKLKLNDDETFNNDGNDLAGQTAEIMAKFRSRIVGRTVVDVGYVISPEDDGEEPTAYPALVMDDGHLLTAWIDDEGNGPGVILFKDARLCQTHIEKNKKTKNAL